MCAVYEFGMDTQRLSFQSTAFAVRKAVAQRPITDGASKAET